MDFFLRPGLEIGPAIRPQLVIANRILLYNSAELEQLLDEELSENPALEATEVIRCPRCGAVLSGHERRFCARCNRLMGDLQPLPWERPSVATSSLGEEDEWGDPITRVAAPMPLSEYLLWQLRPTLAPEDEPLATYLVGNLDERGFLACSVDEACAAVGASREKVLEILSRIQESDPPGIGARDGRECLLIQLNQLERQGRAVPPLARRLVEECWQVLSRGATRQVQRMLQATEDQVQQALQFLAENLTPYPATSHWEIAPGSRGNSVDPADYVRPDIVLTEREDGGVDIELPGARSFELRINPLFAELAGNRGAYEEVSEDQYFCVRDCVDRARLFIRGMEQRWITLRLITLALVQEQEAFLRHGPRHLKPLTRAQLADSLGLHESIVSRAVANKYVQLPNRRIVPMSLFFDDSLPVKDLLREIIEGEKEPLSDQEIAEELSRRGYQVARRTVAKYRDAMGILPAALRFKSSPAARPTPHQAPGETAGRTTTCH